MSSINLPLNGVVKTYKAAVATAANLPGSDNTAGDVRAVIDTGLMYVWSGTAWQTAAPGVGTVTSVGLVDNTGLFNITGSPVLGAGDLTLNSLKTVGANKFFAAPNGSDAAPSFRAIVAADIPTLNQNTSGTAANITASSNTSLTTLSNLSTVGTITSGTWSGTAIAINKGGTGATTANDALNAFLPSQIGKTNQTLVTDGSNTSWAPRGNYMPVATKTGNYTLTATDCLILCDPTTGTITLTLPAAVANQIYVIKRITGGPNQLRVNTTSSQTIDGSVYITIPTLYQSVTLVSDGANWFII